MSALTPKQERFVQEYLIDLNATQAAIRAGYAKPNAHVQGFQLLNKTLVAQAISAAQQKRQERTEITQDRVLQELARIAFFDLRKLYREDGSMKAINELDADSAAVLASVEVVENKVVGQEGDASSLEYVKKAKIFDKGAALTLAMRHLGMLNDKLTVDANVKGSVSYRANMPPRS